MAKTMAKRILSLLLALLMVLPLTVPALAAEAGTEPVQGPGEEQAAEGTAKPAAATTASGTCGGWREEGAVVWVLTDDGTLTISGNGEMGRHPWADYSNSISKIVIKNGVTSIMYSAFRDCHLLTSVSIPASVTSIGDSAFSGCRILTGVTIPAGVTDIENYVFDGCRSLTAITVAGGNKAYSSSGGVLFNKTKTTLIRCPEGKTGSYSIPGSVTSIEDHAFQSCSGLTKVTIPNSVTSIGDCVFYGCSGLTKVTIPNSVTSIGEYAFDSCSGLTSVTIPSGVTSIGNWVFSGCDSLKSVTIPSGVTSIGNWAFMGCDSLKSVTIPSSVISIGDTAFYLCSGLISVTIPDSVIYIGDDAFVCCHDSLVIHGVKGSAAEKYAKTNGITFKGDVTSTAPLAAPKLSKVENTAKGVKVTWGKVTGAEKYRVFYKPSGGSWKKAGDTTSTSYTWTGAKSGTTYQFRVWCVSADGKTQTSDYDGGKSIQYVGAPNYTVSAPATGGIKLRWSKVAGATKYTVFYKTTGSWKTLTTTASTSYTVKSPKDGAKYTFRVRCVNSAGSVTSGYIADKTITYKKPVPAKLAAPKLSKVENTATGIKVTWGKVTGAEKYRVFYKPSGGSWKKAGDTTSTSYTWTGAKSGTTYQIRVWCVSADGKTKTSDYDGVKSIQYIAAPNYTVAKSGTGIKISWSKVAGATKYTVFYKTTGGWKTLTTTASTGYTVKSPKNGTTYTFRVRCVNSAGSVTSGYIADKTLTYKK